MVNAGAPAPAAACTRASKDGCADRAAETGAASPADGQRARAARHTPVLVARRRTPAFTYAHARGGKPAQAGAGPRSTARNRHTRGTTLAQQAIVDAGNVWRGASARCLGV